MQQRRRMTGVTRRTMVRGVAGTGALTSVLGLAACGGVATPDTRTKAPVKFSFWNVRAFGPMEEKLISLYQEKNPNVTIEYVEAAKQGITAAGGSAEEVSALVVRATAGGAIDIAKVEASRTPFGLWHTTPQVPDRTGRSLEIIEQNARRYRAGEPLLNLLKPEDVYTKG